MGDELCEWWLLGQGLGMSEQLGEDMERIEGALMVLREHFDTVQVFATRHEEGEQGGTVVCSRGFGNWMARYGQVGLWLAQERAREVGGVGEEG